MKTNTSSSKVIHLTRVDRIRRRIIDAPQEVCIERARYLTRSMKENWDKHPLTRMSLGLEAILGNITPIIRTDELVVGCRTSKLKGAPLFPENKIRWIEGDVENFDRRELQRALITEAEKQEVKADILPFWKGKTVEEAFEKTLDLDVEADMDKYIFTFMLEITYGIGHFTMDHPTALSKGLLGIIQDAQDKRDILGKGNKDKDNKNKEKILFYEALIRSLRATIRFAQRYATLAEKMAAEEKNRDRARELREIARVCRKVPGEPAQTFHEAVQAIYFTHLVAQIETGGNSISLGRIDQYLYPFYASDLAAGRITPDQAQELISLLFLKTNEIWNVLE
ncbi:MAG: pyruvate formate lyase family protein, partial [Proteobacteria bacterium]|nr:pyruvate formate lyase family protein [Pseudomonadota bacterium]